jgi:putative ABC transport system ATP-binding protein
MDDTNVVVAQQVNHHFGEPPLRKQILFDVSVAMRRGEIVIVTGPSGSGKTTLLTLIGALRSTQDGSLRVLGEELRGASEAALVRVRRRIGYIFQSHNLLDSLTASQNVQMALETSAAAPRRETAARALAALRAVGLENRAHHHPDQLSGGQKQRVAIARALVGEPELVLADEPTASLDKQSGRDVVELMRRLARERGCTVLLVTHDNRILDIADRIVHLEDGCLHSFTEGVLSNTRQLMSTLALNNRRGELTRRVRELPVGQFATLIEHVTDEFQQFLRAIELANTDAFESMLEQVIEAFTLKVGEVVAAERVSILLADEARGELWSKVAQHEGDKPVEIRIPMTTGIAGYAFRTGEAVNVPDAYANPHFNREVDQATGYVTRTVLCMPLFDRNRRPFGVMSLLNKHGGAPFDARDENALKGFATSMGVILETWNEARKRRGPAVQA